jgi:hypothetical protein
MGAALRDELARCGGDALLEDGDGRVALAHKVEKKIDGARCVGAVAIGVNLVRKRL